MINTTRGVRVLWLGGFLLVVGTAVGAGWVLHQPASGTVPAAAVESATQWAVGLGYVDVLEGISKLHPVVSGRVTNVYVAEGDEVKEGDMILSLDNTVPKFKLRMAEADLASALQKLEDAKRLETDHQHKIKMVELNIEGAGYELDAAELDLGITRKLNKPTDPNDKTVLASAEDVKKSEAKVKGAEVKINLLKEKLAELKNADPKGQIELANQNVADKLAQRDMAQRGVFECDLYAPADGTILRMFAACGDVLGSQSPQFAVHFCPNSPRVVRAEILQDFAGQVKKGQSVAIKDDTRHDSQWKGKILRVSDVFTPRRSILQEPFQYNDVRTLECIVSIEPSSQPVRIGQRMRVIIK